MKLANIVTNSKISAPDTFNVVKTMDDIIQDFPTLIIGYDYVNKHYPHFDITNIKLNDNLYWTFKRTEKRDKFEDDLIWFISKVYQDLVAEVNYVFVDPIQYGGKKLRKIVRKMSSLKEKVTYCHGEMLYVYGEKLIFGIDLKLLRYMSLNTDKIKDKIKQASSVFLEDYKILIEYKKSVGRLGTQVRYIPYIYSILNEQNNSSSIIHISREN